MVDLYAQLDAFARDGLGVILHGPSGCGKEYVARRYHRQFCDSKGKGVPWHAVNCAGLGEGALSDLFGHVKGAFTSAYRDREGAFHLAAKGVLFLDEIGDLPEHVQAQLLRALSPGEYMRLGDDTIRKTDNVTVIAATERPLDTLRPSLLMRLGQQLRVPGLEERPDDILVALTSFAQRALLHRQDRRSFPWLTAAHTEPFTDPHTGAQSGPLARAIADRLSLRARGRWPGNLRGLRRAVNLAVCVAPGCATEDAFVESVCAKFPGVTQSAPLPPPPAPPSPPPPPTSNAEGWRRVLGYSGESAANRANIDHLADFLDRAPRKEPIKRGDVDKALHRTAGVSRRWLAVLEELGLIADVGGGQYRILAVPAPDAEPPPAVARRMGAPPGPTPTPAETEQVRPLVDALAKLRGAWFSAESPTDPAAALIARHLASTHTVLWYVFDASPTSFPDFLAQIEQEISARDAPSAATRPEDSLALRTAALAGFVDRPSPGARLPYAVVLVGVDLVAGEEAREALALIPRLWVRCKLVFVGRRMPNYEAQGFAELAGMVSSQP